MSKLFTKRSFIIGASCAIGGYVLGLTSERARQGRTLTSGFPRACSDADCTGHHDAKKPTVSSEPNNLQRTVLLDQLRSIMGPEHVLTGSAASPFSKGIRIGKGEALAVCQPGSLREAADALKACVTANVAVIPQGKNTGLTGGSVPRSELCDRPTVIINMNRLTKIIPIGDQMLCLAGAGIYDLSKVAASRGRESHSILGSIFLNPSVGAGVAFGSGGTQIRKGPAYTERALWCRVNDKGEVELVNTLGINAASNEDLFAKIESGSLTVADLSGEHALLPASNAVQYSQHVCKLDEEVARYNADTSGIEPCRSEGKVMILATLHDTFPCPTEKRTLWVTCGSMEEAQLLKREVLMVSAEDLPISCEYMDRDCFDVIDSAGRAICFAIDLVGIGETLSQFWSIKTWVENMPLPFFDILPDKVMYWFNNFLPTPLPRDLYLLGKSYNHHLLITVADYGQGSLKRTEERLQRFLAEHKDVVVHECKKDELNKVTYFRFAAAPAFRTWCVGRGFNGLSVDYALPKNSLDLPSYKTLTGLHAPLVRMRYAHLGCNVVHEDVAFRPEVDVHECKHQMKAEVEQMGGRLPAEHGHGTEYDAPPSIQERWMRIDPTNAMNPGVGGLPYTKDYK